MFKNRWILLLSVLLIGLMGYMQVYAQEPDVQVGEEDVLVLGEDINPEIHKRIMSLLTREYGDKARHWTEQPKDEVLHYYAYPYTDDVRNKNVRKLINQEVMSLRATTCLYLYDYFYYWGTQFSTCGTQGTSRYMTMGSFDNKASSYYEGTTSNAVKLYDNINFSGTLATYWDDMSGFPSSVNNKTSSIRAWY